MKTRITTTLLALLLAHGLLVGTAQADKFYFQDPEAQAEGNAQAALVGVILDETDDHYVIRVMGGTITVAKSSIFKIEKDGLTEAQIQDQEEEQAEELAEADKQRRKAQAVEASAIRSAWAEAKHRRRLEEIAAAEAAAEAAANARPVTKTIKVYDPVLHVVVEKVVEAEGEPAATATKTSKVAEGDYRR